MTEMKLDHVIGEIAAISEEIEEFAAQGDNVERLLKERENLVYVVDQYLIVQQIKAAPGATGTANASQ
ncbi:hypothetical protein [Domibacillus mangrovi]|uniref:Uncharacterized protein n=1 Tax=Domibacillus mangrovi TaxID=1714354 RepID=A0A1Q5P223_9BACI|nr:hypothetical protein [Domibacillus mangrovi]OKL36231.1 hypothetical protein BLL40_11520 [Domibacillus mangrovi]